MAFLNANQTLAIENTESSIFYLLSSISSPSLALSMQFFCHLTNFIAGRETTIYSAFNPGLKPGATDI
jgi:hypothetical protein